MADTPPQRSRPAANRLSRVSERDATVEDMVEGRKLRRVQPIKKFQQDLVNQAGETIAGAQAALKASPKVAFNAAYDAVRFTVDAHLNASGLRVESGEGGHAHRVSYARLAMGDILTADDINFYAAARQVRHQNEYPAPEEHLNLTEANARSAIDVAKRFHEAVTKQLKPRPRKRPGT